MEILVLELLLEVLVLKFDCSCLALVNFGSFLGHLYVVVHLFNLELNAVHLLFEPELKLSILIIQC